MDRSARNQFKGTIFTSLSKKSAVAYGEDCSIDFFPYPNQDTKVKKTKEKVNYVLDGLSYLDQYLGKELFNPKQNILVVRKGKPYPISDLTVLNQKNDENESSAINSPQKKMSKLNIDLLDNNQNNINDRSTETITFDTCGSPLKLQTYADLSTCDSPCASPTFVKKSAPVYIPEGLPCSRSRQLISLFNVNYTQLMTESTAVFPKLPSFWVLCDKTDRRCTALMGSQPVLSESGGYVQRGLRLTTVTQVETDDILASSSKVFKQNIHENKCFARYDLVAPSNTTMEDSIAYQGSLSLEFQWKNGTKLLQKPEYHSEVVIKASVHSGDIRSPAFWLFEELSILKSFMTGFITGEITWAASQDHAPLLEMVKELIESQKLGDSNTKLQGEESDNSPTDELKLKARFDYDFTDELWKILITCSSYSDLTTSLNYIFKALSRGEFQPAVHKKNKTMMAQYIRDSYTGRLIIPHLGGMFPLKLVVEMGIEKLRSDYIHAFLSQDLTTPSHLDYFLQADVDLEEKILRMEKMQYSLEMVVMIHLFLKLSYSIIGTCARKMLKHFETNEINPAEVFEFPVQTNPVLPVVKDTLPSLWSLTVERKVGDTELSEYKVWTLTTNQPFIHLPNDIDRDEQQENEKSRFYLTTREEFLAIGY